MLNRYSQHPNGIVDSQFDHDAGPVLLDGFNADMEPLGNGSIGTAFANQL